MKSNTLAIALAALLVGGVAVAAFQNNRAGSAYDKQGLQYAEVVRVDPVTESGPMYATVLAVDPVRDTVTTSNPRQVCNDVVVQERMPERDGLVGGTIAGAIIGGALGNQVGDGNGQKLATVAGAVAGGYAGRRIDQRHVGGQVVSGTQTQCHTVNDSSQTTRVVAYNVTYRNPDGTVGTMRSGDKPGERINLGEGETVVGYDVTYRLDGAENSIRMQEKPGEKLPVVDGEVVVQVAAAESDAERG